MIQPVVFAQEGKIVRETINFPSLEGNLFGDSPNRWVTIYLPPSYDTDIDRRYPVVYLIHGYTGNHNLWTGGSYIRGNILSSMKSWLNQQKVREMIVVMPNSHNKLRGSWYTNSAATGNWADAIAKDLVEYIDNTYRTLPQRNSRSVVGHSMGGFGGLELGMLYPEVFGCMGGMAGVYSSERRLRRLPNGLNASTAYANASTLEDWPQFNSSNWVTQLLISECAAYAPNPDNPPFYCDFPFTYTDTQPRKKVKNQEAYDKFMEYDILGMTEEHLDALLSMLGIYIDCGTRDSLITDARELHEKLESLGVKHVYKEFSGDHSCCVMTSTGDVLEVFSSTMSFEILSKPSPDEPKEVTETKVSVQSRDKLTTMWGWVKSDNFVR
jgi:S-formylglutathione hydrolase FrmB